MSVSPQRPFEMRLQRWRRALLPLAIAVVVVGLPTVWWGPSVFSKWKQGQLIERADAAMARQDLATAILNLRRVLSMNIDHLEATRRLAKIAGDAGSPDALALWERVCKLSPGSFDEAHAWARAALQHGALDQAREAHLRMTRLAPPSLAYHEVAARLAAIEGRPGDALNHYREALKSAPTSAENQLGVALLEIAGGSESERAHARETLQQLRTQPAVRRDATRALITDLLQRTRVSAAAALAREFVSEPEATFEDRLQYLAILRSVEKAGATFDSQLAPALFSISLVGNAGADTFTSYFTTLGEHAASDPARAAKLVVALNSLELPLLAADWSRALTPEMRRIPPVAPALADTFCLLRDWPRLRELLRDADWFGSDFLRAAFAARLAQMTGDPAGASAHWKAAVNLSEYQSDRLILLGRFASNWGWRQEWEELAWTAARTSKRPRDSLVGLADYYRSRRDATRLAAVLNEILAIEPTNLPARKEAVRLSFLLKGDPYRTGVQAEELYRQHPADPDIAVTYALIQHKRELYADALAILDRLPPEQRRASTVAGFYGLILIANKRKPEAAEYLALARGAPLLREEEAILESARSLLD